VKAIEYLISNQRLKTVCRKLSRSGDLYQDVILAALELPKGKLEHIYQSEYLEFWAIRVAYNIHSKMCKSEGKWQPQGIETITNITLERYELINKVDATIQLEKVQCLLNRMAWYEAELFLVYLDEGSFRKAEAATGIGYRGIKKVVDKVRKKIKESI
jgi:DNA-directed RNA polymerase specialized sigma24 family protein